jgi:hypothetical protein
MSCSHRAYDDTPVPEARKYLAQRVSAGKQQKKWLFTALPKAGAEVPLLDRSALKEGYSNPENALASPPRCLECHNHPAESSAGL